MIKMNRNRRIDDLRGMSFDGNWIEIEDRVG